MVTQIDEATGATPTWTTAVTSCKFGASDAVNASTATATPTATGTNFTFIKSFAMDIVTVNSLNMTNLKIYKSAAEPTGLKLWYVITHAIASYTQATAAPTSTGDNNSTAPTMNSVAGTAMPVQGSAVQTDAGAFNTTGRVGKLDELCVGIDATNTYAGTSGSGLPNLGWTWTEGLRDTETAERHDLEDAASAGWCQHEAPVLSFDPNRWVPEL